MSVHTVIRYLEAAPGLDMEKVKHDFFEFLPLRAVGLSMSEIVRLQASVFQITPEMMLAAYMIGLGYGAEKASSDPFYSWDEARALMQGEDRETAKGGAA